MIKNQTITQMSQIEHVLKRPSMYVGSIVQETQEEFTLSNEDNKFKITERDYIPALIKTFNEWIDNSIDEYVRTKGKFANKISVKITDKTFECSDNGRGIPNDKMDTLSGDSKYQAEVAFTEMLSGANYDNDDEATIGTNGLGAKAGSIFAKKSIIVNDDGKKSIKITTKNNLSDVKVTEAPSKSTGVHIKVYPDLEYFGISEIDSVHMDVIKERLLHLSISYPGITFKFNSKVLRINPKNYFDMFNCTEFVNFGDVQIGVGPSDADQFEHFSLVNGLVVKSGGTHMDHISRMIVEPIRTKLSKKFKSIKPADVKSKMRMVIIFRNFQNARYTSQTKEQITNSRAEIVSYLGKDANKEIEKLVKKIQRNDDIMLPITELFALREQAKANANLKKLNKTKRIKSEKYLPATKNKKVLLLCEGDSAVGGTMPALGREDFGYYALKGVPLNAYDSPVSSFTGNKELSEVFSIVQSEGYEYIATASDSDADGAHIKGLLLGFFKKYLPEYIEQGRFAELLTPVQVAMKNKKPVRWIYSIGDGLNLKPGEEGKYMKGLGSWKVKDLQHVVKTDGIENMIKIFKLDDEVILDDWLSADKTDKRKEYISDNYFDITAV